MLAQAHNTRRPLKRRALLLVATLLVALIASLAALAPPGHAEAGDLVASAESDFGCGKKMYSDATYWRGQNRILGHAHLVNDCQLAGFHGAVVAVLSDANGRIVGYGMSQRYGIDGKGPCWLHVISVVPWRTEWRCPPPAERHEFWEDSVRPEAATSATKLELIQFASPNSFLESLASLRAHLEEAVQIGKSVAEIYALVAAAG